MRKPIWIVAIAIAALALTMAAAAWAASQRSRERRAAANSQEVLTKDGLTREEFERQNAQAAVEARVEQRREFSGSTLWTDYIPPGLDQATAGALAALFRQQAPVPEDRVAHFRWLDRARKIVSFVGWGATFNAVERHGDELWVELNLAPHLESERGIGGLSNDNYIETYVVRDGHFHYMGGRPAPLVRREVRPDLASGVFFIFD